VYARSIAFGFTGLDDRDVVVEDQAFLGDPASLLRVFGRSYMHVVDTGHAYYRPLVTASLVADAQWSGARPLGYHLTNVILHVVATVLVCRLLRAFGFGRGVALGAGIIFAVHPTLAPAVAWIPGRNDSLLAVFALGSWIFFMRDRVQPALRDRVAHLAFFGLALVTKETACALPLVWLAQVALLEGRGRKPVRSLFGLMVGWVALVAGRMALHPVSPPTRVGDVVSNLLELVAGLGRIVVPFPPRVLAVALDRSLVPGAIAVAAIAASASLLPGVRRRVVLFGLTAYALLLAPSLLLPGTLVLDSRLYLPAVGVLLAAGAVVSALAVERRVLVAFGGVVAGVLALVTLAFEGAFRDPRVFAREAVAGSPHSSLAHLCLGQSYQLEGRDDLALAEYRTALALGPAEVVHNDIAVLAMKDARWDEAEQELREELAVNPRFARAHYNLGIVHRRQGRMAESCASEERAHALAPDDERIREERERDCGALP
jgi:hypothetical protein